MQTSHREKIFAAADGHSFARLGIIGGGQLARMTAQAALQLGCEVVVLDRETHSPAAQLATRSLVGDWDAPQELLKLASQVDVVTLENEFLNPDALAVIENAGRELYPNTATLRRVQDKLIQKKILNQCGLPTTHFAEVGSVEDVIKFGSEYGWPIVLKTRRNGYDGKGNFTIHAVDEVALAWRALAEAGNAVYVEAFCPYTRELATIVTRSALGSVVVYPVVETVQRNHICHLVRAPAQISTGIAQTAASFALRAIEAIDGTGSFGVEMFLTNSDQVLINELAPRVHNFGHYSIEACVCSQFENHVRAVMGWPLGSTDMVSSSAAMVNLLGSRKGSGAPLGMAHALGITGAHIHVYGKAITSAGRKMGHITALGDDISSAENIARRAADLIGFGGENED